jgi:hypothetical protein
MVAASLWQLVSYQTPQTGTRVSPLSPRSRESCIRLPRVDVAQTKEPVRCPGRFFGTSLPSAPKAGEPLLLRALLCASLSSLLRRRTSF